LAAASPGTAELHHQDVAFELVERIRLVIDALELEARSEFPEQGALPGLSLARDDLRATTEQRRRQYGAATPNPPDILCAHGTQLTPCGLMSQTEKWTLPLQLLLLARSNPG
jgi:hypothetical protein